MSWDALIGQEPGKKYLRSLLAAERLAHAYLFKGPAGVGKRTAARIFIQAALCRQPLAPDIACGNCKSCRWLSAQAGSAIQHPDVISLIKFGADDKGDELVGDHEPLIPMKTIQYVCEQLHRTPMAGARRAVIIPEAQRFCRGRAEAANSFLKTLEEPPAAALIILTSSQPEALLETIVSRVQAVSFRRLSTAEITAGLAAPLPAPRAQASFDSGELSAAVLLADGSLGRALELLHGDLKTWRSAVLKALERFDARSCPEFGLQLWSLAEVEGKRLFSVEQAEGNTLGDEADEPGQAGEENEGEAKTETGWKRYVFRRLLELCEVCFRDGLLCAAANAQETISDGEAMPLLQPDQRSLSAALAQKFGDEGCLKVLAALRDSFLANRLYVRGDVVGRALSGKMVEALAS